MGTTTHFIGGQRLTLEQGQRYIAERPFLGADEHVTTVTIYNCETDAAAIVLPEMPRAEADAFIQAFNGEPSGFSHGRVWR